MKTRMLSILFYSLFSVLVMAKTTESPTRRFASQRNSNEKADLAGTIESALHFVEQLEARSEGIFSQPNPRDCFQVVSGVYWKVRFLSEQLNRDALKIEESVAPLETLCTDGLNQTSSPVLQEKLRESTKDLKNALVNELQLLKSK